MTLIGNGFKWTFSLSHELFSIELSSISVTRLRLISAQSRRTVWNPWTRSLRLHEYSIAHFTPNTEHFILNTTERRFSGIKMVNF